VRIREIGEKKVAQDAATAYNLRVTNISNVENFAWFNSH